MSLQHNVSTLLQEPIGATRAYAIDERVLVDEAAPAHERITGDATFLRTKNGVLVTAHLRAEHAEACSRCLRPLDLPLEITIEEEFLTTDAAATEEPEAFRIDEQHTLDLEEAVRQYWTLTLPMQPLCRSDCQGLCPRCGSDLNEGACSCPQEVDERWSALRELVQQTEGS